MNVQPCPGCGRTVKIPESLIGTEVKCPVCGAVFLVPGCEPESAPLAAGPASGKCEWPDLELSQAVIAPENDGGVPTLPPVSSPAAEVLDVLPAPDADDYSVRRGRRSADWDAPSSSYRRNGRGPRNHGRPWYLWLTMLMPLALPGFAVPLNVYPQGSAGVALWTSVGVGLSCICLLLALIRDWPGYARLLIHGGCTGIGCLLIPFCMFIGLVARGPSIDATAWKEFTPPEGGFRVEMPGTPTLRRQNLPQINIPMNMYILELKNIDTAFIAGFLDFPENAEQQVSSEEIFDASVREAGKALSGMRKIGERKLTCEGHPGREVVYSLPGRGVIIYRMYLVDDRYYIL